MNREDALKYLVHHAVDCDEWSGAGMYNALREVILFAGDSFEQEYLDSLLVKAEEF